MNKVLLTGRLTRDPELRVLASGKNVTTFSVATNEYVGNGKEKAEFQYKGEVSPSGLPGPIRAPGAQQWALRRGSRIQRARGLGSRSGGPITRRTLAGRAFWRRSPRWAMPSPLLAGSLEVSDCLRNRHSELKCLNLPEAPLAVAARDVLEQLLGDVNKFPTGTEGSVELVLHLMESGEIGATVLPRLVCLATELELTDLNSDSAGQIDLCL